MCRFLVPFFAGLYPALFFVSNNSHVFSLKYNIVILISTATISTFLCLTLSFLLLSIYRLVVAISGVNKHSWWTISSESLSTFLTANISILMCFYLLRNTLLSLGIGTIYLMIGILIVIVGLSYFTHKNGLNPLLNILITFTIISAVQLSINVVNKQNQVVDVIIPNKNKIIYNNLQFKKKPNVYLIITESYPNKAALKAVYNIDNSLFYRNIQKLGFGINHNFFSNYNHTLASLPSLFAMEHHFGLISYDNLDSTGGRRILELTSYNPVVSVFRNNGYKINYFHTSIGLVPNGAKADFCFPTPSILHGSAIFLTHQKIMEPTIFSKQSVIDLPLLKAKINGVVNTDSPSFNFIYYNKPDHSPSRFKVRTKLEMNQVVSEHRVLYEKLIKEANIEIIDFLTDLIKNDPNSLIVITGDHGSWGYRFGIDANGKQIPYPLSILDRFGVLSGLYGPPELSNLLTNGSIKSHVNLFKYIFSFLCKNDIILKTLAPDDSYDYVLVMAIKDNKILSSPKKIEVGHQ